MLIIKKLLEGNLHLIDFKNASFQFPIILCMGNFGDRANFRLPVLADLHILGPRESKKHKISMVSKCLVVSPYVSLLAC